MYKLFLRRSCHLELYEDTDEKFKPPQPLDPRRYTQISVISVEGYHKLQAHFEACSMLSEALCQL